jgi:ABC-type Co2+ transport system permease subunit
VIIGTEMILGWALFRLFTRIVGQRAKPGRVAAVATVLTLIVTTTMLVGIVAIGGPSASRRESGALDPSTLRFGNPLANGLVANHLAGPETGAEPRSVTTRRFATVVFILGPFGWALEAAITAGIIGFVARTRPALVYGGPLGAEAHLLIGDEELTH